AEGEQHGFLEPLVHTPGGGAFLALDLLGDAQLPRVEQAQGALDRVADVALRRRRDVRPVFEGGGDEALKSRMRHARRSPIAFSAEVDAGLAQKTRQSRNQNRFPIQIGSETGLDAMRGFRLSLLGVKSGAWAGAPMRRVRRAYSSVAFP